jgi:hypothetical protein
VNADTIKTQLKAELAMWLAFCRWTTFAVWLGFAVGFGWKMGDTLFLVTLTAALNQ